MTRSVAVADQHFHVRSISMPSGPHPLTAKVEEELHNLRTCVASSSSSMAPQAMCNGLQGLGDLYECIEELLRLPRKQQALSHPNQRQWVEAELEASVRLLDLCGAMRDSLVAAKEHIQELQSALRRNGAAVESKSDTYIRSRRKAEKDIKNCFRSLKQMGSRSGSYQTLDGDHDLPTVVGPLVEAREITVSLLRSISSFLSITGSKALQKRKVAACDVQNEAGNEVQSVDVLLYASFQCVSCKDADDGRVQKAQHQLKTLEASIEGLETGLQSVFRRLIRNRVSLLNILSI